MSVITLNKHSSVVKSNRPSASLEYITVLEDIYIARYQWLYFITKLGCVSVIVY